MASLETGCNKYVSALYFVACHYFIILLGLFRLCALLIIIGLFSGGARAGTKRKQPQRNHKDIKRQKFAKAKNATNRSPAAKHRRPEDRRSSGSNSQQGYSNKQKRTPNFNTNQRQRLGKREALRDEGTHKSSARRHARDFSVKKRKFGGERQQRYNTASKKRKAMGGDR